MIGTLVLIIIPFLTIGVSIALIYKAIKRTNNLAEKIIDIILAVIVFTLVGIYYIDRYNVPTRLNLVDNINTQNWLAFISNYLTGIITAVIAAIVAVWTTLYQIKKNNEENEKSDKENLRVQNLPILKFSVDTEHKKHEEDTEPIITNMEESPTFYLNISVKNIGLNNIKSFKADLRSSIISNTISRLFGVKSIVTLEKGEEIELNYSLNLDITNKPYELFFTFYYQDVLSNWYRQRLIVYYTMTNLFSDDYHGVVKYDVTEEEQFIEIDGKDLLEKEDNYD